VPVLQVRVTNPGSLPATLTSLTVTGSGSGNEATGIQIVRVFADLNGNGQVDGGETQLGSGVFSSDDGTVLLAITAPLAGGASLDLLVTYDLSPTPPFGNYQASLAPGALAGAGVGGQALQFTGVFPLSGAVLTLAAATATPTVTPTPTLPPLFATPTSTLPPGDGGGVIILPNPVPGDGPVTVIPPAYSGALPVGIRIYTVSLRKVLSLDLGVLPHSNIPLALRDQWDKPLSTGLYYVVVTVDGERSVGRLFVLR
jgi:hypothetical protein